MNEQSKVDNQLVSNTFHYIDDLLTLNNPHFDRVATQLHWIFLKVIGHIGLQNSNLGHTT